MNRWDDDPRWLLFRHGLKHVETTQAGYRHGSSWPQVWRSTPCGFLTMLQRSWLSCLGLEKSWETRNKPRALPQSQNHRQVTYSTLIYHHHIYHRFSRMLLFLFFWVNIVYHYSTFSTVGVGPWPRCDGIYFTWPWQMVTGSERLVYCPGKVNLGSPTVKTSPRVMRSILKTIRQVCTHTHTLWDM